MTPSRTLPLLAVALAATYLSHPGDAPEPRDPDAAPAHAGPCPTGVAVVDLADDAGPAAVEALPGLLASPADARTGVWRLSGSPAATAWAVTALRGDPRVEVAECEVRYHAAAASKPRRWVPDDPLLGRQWHLELAGAPEAWALSPRLGAGAVVAVIDTGVAAVPDLDPRRLLPGRTFGSGLPGGEDDHGHGTHVAGTIAQSTNNGLGTAGMAGGARILPLKVLGADGSGSSADVAAAIHEAAARGANVINLSLGSDQPSEVVARAVAAARASGTVVVAAAGNSGAGRVGYPAADPGAFAVGAVGPEGRRAPYSQHGRHLDIAAPGGDVRTRRDDDPRGVLQNTLLAGARGQSGYLSWQGTSMATPHVAGAAALLAAAGVTRPADVEAILRETARRPDGWNEREYGAGLLDAGAALRAAHARYAPLRGVVLAAAAMVLLSLAGGAWWRVRSVAGLATIAAGVGCAAWVAGALGRSPIDSVAELLGVGAAGSPIVWSALPAVLAAVLAPRAVRPIAAGVAVGVAAWLLHGAAVLPCVLRGLPGGMLADRAWLLVQGAAALAAAVLVLRAARPDAAGA